MAIENIYLFSRHIFDPTFFGRTFPNPPADEYIFYFYLLRAIHKAVLFYYMTNFPISYNW